uniref:Uncharacterized protein n=1 Tax=Ditylum brightwellii TaxID=49249 RepID=A0A7S4SWZ5_9STRA
MQGQMSPRFYDETLFFSKQMIFGRFDTEKVVHEEVMPAFQRYVQTHYDMVLNTTPDVSSKRTSNVLDRQAAYDSYSAERDPATKMFEAMFGVDWSEGFVHDFLFDQSRKDSS